MQIAQLLYICFGYEYFIYKIHNIIIYNFKIITDGNYMSAVLFFKSGTSNDV
jgi:hypothetical protein